MIPDPRDAPKTPLPTAPAGAGPTATYVMYVRGLRPYEGPRTPLPISRGAHLLGFFVPIPVSARFRAAVMPEADLAPFGSEHGLSRPEAQCLALVLDLARKLHRSVYVVDVNHQERPASEIESDLGDPPFPVLLRPDGARLEGTDSFSPRSVRRFLRDA